MNDNESPSVKLIFDLFLEMIAQSLALRSALVAKGVLGDADCQEYYLKVMNSEEMQQARHNLSVPDGEALLRRLQSFGGPIQ
jgi:uncharacterized protein YaaW (UPF0174 family)